MTTYSQTVLKVDMNDDGDASGLSYADVSVALADGVSTLSYRTTQTYLFALDDVEFVENQSIYSTRFDGNYVDENMVTYEEAGQIVWDGGTRTTYVVVLEVTLSDDEVSGYLIPLGGDPLPTFTSISQLEAFTLSSDFGSAPASSGFGSGQSFSLAALPGVSISENDYVSNNDDDGEYATGAGNDTIAATARGDDSIDGGTGNDLVIFPEIEMGEFFVYAEGEDLIVFQGDSPDYLRNIEMIRIAGQDWTPEELLAAAPEAARQITGSEVGDLLTGGSGADLLNGAGGNDTIDGGAGADTLIGGNGNDDISGGGSTFDLRDVVYGGNGNDTIDGGYGNDELRGDAGNDNIAGGFGADTVIGGTGDDVLTGSAFGDAIFGGDGADFINGGFGFDRVNGGAGGDRFFHTGNAGHGSDWIQDYNAADGDVLMYGSAASAADFLVQRATTPTAGDAGVQELFVTHRASGVLLWALVDGDGQGEINVLAGGQTFDLLV